MNTVDVYRSLDGVLYSEGVTRVFGENRVVAIDGSACISSVLPLMCDPEECELVKVGIMEISYE